MPESKELAANLTGNGVILLLVAAAGTYFVAHQVVLEGSRPATSEASIHERGRPQDIDARLWQDPFRVVAEQLEKTPELNPKNCDDPKLATVASSRTVDSPPRFPDHCRSPLSRSSGQPAIVVAASVSGARYAEDHEFRQRTRYAILAGLSEENFVADDPQHIGFYWPAATGRVAAGGAYADSRDGPIKAELRINQSETPDERLPEFVPFEWLSREQEGRPEQKLLLLWFDEDVLDKRPLRQFGEFFCGSLRATDGPSAGWSKAIVLGPQSSTVLRDMVQEYEADWSSVRCPHDARPEFYVYSATAEDSLLTPKTGKT